MVVAGIELVVDKVHCCWRGEEASKSHLDVGLDTLLLKSRYGADSGKSVAEEASGETLEEGVVAASG